MAVLVEVTGRDVDMRYHRRKNKREVVQRDPRPGTLEEATTHPGGVPKINPGRVLPRISCGWIIGTSVHAKSHFDLLGVGYTAMYPCRVDTPALVTAARLLVEVLIEGKVTEAELIAAASDPASDRALLAGLTSAGLDAADEPLFPDLDALVALLTGTSAAVPVPDQINSIE